MRPKVIATKQTEDLILGKFNVWSKALSADEIKRDDIPLSEWEWEFLSTLDTRMQPSEYQRKALHEIATRLYFLGVK